MQPRILIVYMLLKTLSSQQNNLILLSLYLLSLEIKKTATMFAGVVAVFRFSI